MTKILHHSALGIVGSLSLLGAIAAQSATAHAQPAPMPVPTPIAVPDSAPVDSSPVPTTAAPTPAANVAPSFTTPEISAPSMTTPTAAASAPSPATADDGEHGPKSPSTATGYAALGILSGPVFLGLAVAVGDGGSEGLATGLGLLSAFGFLAGPSAGRWYVGELGGGPLIARGLGAGLMLGGVAASFCWDNCGDNSSAETAIFAGLGLYVGATIYDLATAGDVAREYNRNHRRSSTNLTFAPMVKRSEGPGGLTGTTTGLMLGGSF